jgi:hypothetical protein
MEVGRGGSSVGSGAEEAVMQIGVKECEFGDG